MYDCVSVSSPLELEILPLSYQKTGARITHLGPAENCPTTSPASRTVPFTKQNGRGMFFLRKKQRLLPCLALKTDCIARTGEHTAGFYYGCCGDTNYSQLHVGH